VVEDDRLVRDYVLTQLHSLGYVTLQAANAAEALAIVAAGKPFDLLFTDVIMPGKMNGRQLADELMKTRPDLKVVYTSGYTERDHPSRPAGFRRDAAGQTLPQIGSRADHPQGAERLKPCSPDERSDTRDFAASVPGVASLTRATRVPTTRAAPLSSRCVSDRQRCAHRASS